MDSGFFPANHGVNFDSDSGKIYYFYPETVTVATCWPKPMAWQKTRRGWRHTRLTNSFFFLPKYNLEKQIRCLEKVIDEDGQFHFPFMLSSWDKEEIARLNWYSRIPAPVRKLIVDFRSRHWHLLSLAARCGTAALDLLQSSPALAFMLASNWVYHKPAVQRPLRSARTLLKQGKNQKDILRWLRFPPTKSSRHVLSRVVKQSIDVTRLLYLRDAMQDPVRMKSLRHHQRLNAGALRILTDADLISHTIFSLIEEIAHNRREDSAPHSAYELRDSINMFQRIYPRQKLPVFSSCARLSQVHNELIQRFHDLPPENLVFPKPPLGGNEKIIPILNAQELWQEGVDMNHCVSSYSRQIAIDKNVFIYKVLGPERCTLSIRKSGKSWRIDQLKKSSNRHAADSTILLVKSWLNHQNLLENNGITQASVAARSA